MTRTFQMTKDQSNHYWEHKNLETSDTQGNGELHLIFLTGHAFFTEIDLKLKFKMDPTNRAVLAILRQSGRLRESRGQGHVRYILP